MRHTLLGDSLLKSCKGDGFPAEIADMKDEYNDEGECVGG